MRVSGYLFDHPGRGPRTRQGAADRGEFPRQLHRSLPPPVMAHPTRRPCSWLRRNEAKYRLREHRQAPGAIEPPSDVGSARAKVQDSSLKLA
jgi:hypothetical protein